MSSTTDIYTVYKILNLVNSKVYIGITTKKPEKRWKQHLNNYKYFWLNQALYKAMRKYGPNNFQFSIIEQTNDLNILKELEIKYIQENNSFGSTGYNMTLGGDGAFGFKHSEKTKDKIANLQKERTHSDKAKEKMSAAKIGKPSPWKGKTPSEAARKKMSEAKRGSNNHNYGKPRSDEVKRKISESNKLNRKSKCRKKKL